jgi:hypothetical protein
MSDELAPIPDASDPPLTEADYAAIYRLLMESARGRRFLAEYARRNRQADTKLVLAAIARIESAIESWPAEPATAPAGTDLPPAAPAPVMQDAPVAQVAPVAAPPREAPRPAGALADDIVWVGEHVRRSSEGLPGPIPGRPAAERIAGIELPEVAFVALPRPAQASLPAGTPTTDMLADIFDLDVVEAKALADAIPEPEPEALPVPAPEALPVPAPEAEPEALPVQEPVSPAEIEALTAADESAMSAVDVAPAASREAAAPTDPLAPLHALSEEEKIALFG